MIATAPGKLILTGEYAVLDGAPALVVAVDRRVAARRHTGPRGSSPFLIAVVDELAARYGADHPATRAAMEIVVDSRAFFLGTTKLGGDRRRDRAGAGRTERQGAGDRSRCRARRRGSCACRRAELEAARVCRIVAT
jgi:hypothetical protein